MTQTRSEFALRLFTSNRMEILIESLADVLRRPLASPLDEEIIVVQSRGMARWVSMELARHHGICANVRCPFPVVFEYEVFQKILQDIPQRPPFDPRVVTWKIMRLLPSCLSKKGFTTLKNYLSGGGDYLKSLQLAERIADTFIQYLIFRPEMVLEWEENKEDHWQAVLWRELVQGDEKNHRARLGRTFLNELNGAKADTEGFPERVSVFGISALPRFHMQIFAAMARFTEVNLFLMNPCKAYWGDIVSDWEIKRALDRESAQDIGPEALHYEKGNSLLASMGRLGRDFFDLVNEFTCEEVTSYEEPGDNTLLSCVQSDILNLLDRGHDPETRKGLSLDDTSIQIHSCHSPMREIEVLYDRLLDAFEQDAALLPGDVLVMTPNIETYAPYIQAVFDVSADDATRFPFSIADRSARQESEIIDTFLSMLDLCGSRFGASHVLAVLESPAVRRRFDLSGADLDLIRRWVADTGIRWGKDGDSRAALGLPAYADNTWMAGLKRLLLGFAMPGGEKRMFGGILPYDDVEGEETAALGKFVEFVDRLFVQVQSFETSKTLSGWSMALDHFFESFFLPDQETEEEARFLRRTLLDLAESQDLSGFDKKVDIGVIKYRLGQQLEREGFGFGFITGGITFCAMLPMRSIPFKIICLVGMNSDAFPRQSKPLGFDLIAKHPRRGDRSRRHDDRYLFLEAILSAREKLYISYVGQSIRDNSAIPPSVLVSELSDYIEQGFEIEGGQVLDHVVVSHRLQAFSPDYFREDKRLFSYFRANYEAAEQLVQARKAPPAFISEGLSAPEEEWKTLSLDDLCRFFTHPSQYMLNRRLGIYLEEGASVLEEREPFDVEGLDKYLLEQKLVEWALSGRRLNDCLSLARASGRLPPGATGECIYERFSRGVRRFVAMTQPYLGGAKLGALEVELDISGFRLTGVIDGIYPDRLVQYRYTKVKPKDRLRLWIHHLALNCMRADGYPGTSTLAALKSRASELEWAAWDYSPVENSEEILKQLLETYWAGLNKPIHFLPRLSWDYAERVLKKKSDEQSALKKAGEAWIGSDFVRGESRDPYYQLCFGHGDPLDSQFEQLAVETFGPLIACEKDVKI